MDLSRLTAEMLWPNALGVIPVAIMVAALCRLFSTRSGKGGATRHALWATVLVCFLLPPVLPRLKIPNVVPTDGSRGGAEAGSTLAPPIPAAPAARPAVEPTSLASKTPRPPHAMKEPVVVRNRPAARQPSGDGRVTRPASARGPIAPTSTAVSPVAAPTTLTLPALVAMESSAPPVWTHAGGPMLDDPAPGPASRADTVSAPPAAPVFHGAPPSAFRLERVPARSTASPASAARALVGLMLGDAESEARGALAALTPDLDAWRVWLGKLAPVRDAVATVPPVPASIWLAGAALIVAVAGLRIAAFQHVLRGGRVPRREVQRDVEEAARVLGLRRVPRTIMVSGRVPPMIWCGRVCTLVLPQGLWNELDGAGRRAVVLHELAHLRRRDHWVRWVEIAASALYWWHPLVWWVRHRLREEADLCCDAWVTALLPSHRRAYAQALLSTRVYLSDPSRGGAMGTPPVGLGVTTATARRFARRLTMVMKGRNRPGLSMFGAALSISVIGAAVVATPLWACPPDEVAKQQAKEKEKLAKGQYYKVKSKQNEAALEAERAAQIAEDETRRAAEIGEREARRAAEIAERESTRARAIADREAARAEREAQRAAMEAERAYAAAAAETTPEPPRPAKAPKPPKPPKTPRPPVAAYAPVPPAPPAPPAPPGMPAPAALPTPPPAPPMPDDATTYERYMRGQPVAPAPTPRARRMAPSGAVPGQPAPGGGERIEQLEQRLDRLEQQIERLQRLMERRSASPAPRNRAGAGLMSPQSVGGEPVARVYHLPEGKLEALTSLLSREDVPVLVSRMDDGLQVQATPGQHAAMGAFLALINPESAGEVEIALAPDEPVLADPPFNVSIPDIDVNVEPLEIEIPAELPGMDVNLDVQPLIARAMTLDEFAARVSERSTEQTQQLLERLTERLSTLRDRAAELAEKAEEMQSRADDLKSEAGDLESGAAEMDEATRSHELSRASEMLSKAEVILATAAGLSARADNAHESMHALRDAVQQLAGTLCRRICGEDCTHCSDSCPKCNGSLDLDDDEDESPGAEDKDNEDCPKASPDCDKAPSAGGDESEEKEAPIIR